MNIFKKNNEKKTTQKLPMTGKVRKGFRAYCAVIAAATLVCGMSVTAFAASDPITVVNNLSDFIFGLIRAIGLILLAAILWFWYPLHKKQVDENVRILREKHKNN